MHDSLCAVVVFAVTDHLRLFGFLSGAGALLGLLAFDLRRSAHPGQKKNEPMQFLAPYRDENGMPIYYEAGEDPTERYAQRVLARARRANSNHTGR